MNLFGKQLSTKELRQRVGNMDQIAGIRLVQLEAGAAHPARAALVHTGSGLEFTVFLDRCMDISSASFQGRAMGWRATPGDVAPHYYEAEGIRWLRSYFGGLLTTCGLSNVGAPTPDSALLGNGLHGRIGNTPARDVCITQRWEGNDYVLRMSGIMRETVLFGEKLALERTVWTKLGEHRFWIHDEIVNEGFEPVPFQVLYHCNIGWPAVDAGSRMISPSLHVAPRDDEARDGAKDWWRVDPPTRRYREKVYFHDMAAARGGQVTAAIVNAGFDKGHGFGVYVTYNKKQLPRFVQWKQMGEQDYTVGLEPSNCGVEGRHVDEELGLLEQLRPGERRTVELEFGAITTKDQLKAIEAPAKKVKYKIVNHYTEFTCPPSS